MISRSVSSDITSPYNTVETPMVPGISLLRGNSIYGTPLYMGSPRTYADLLEQCRFFYRNDPIASTTVNRMVDLAATQLTNKPNNCTPTEVAYFNEVLKRISRVVRDMMLEYLIDGFVVTDYRFESVMESVFDPESSSRKRYTLPTDMWIRNPDRITLKKRVYGNGYNVFVQVSNEEKYFIDNEGVYPDGTTDYATYDQLVTMFPEFVIAVKRGESAIQLEHVIPILRRPTAFDDTPQPFLQPALASLKHKLRIKQMDYNVATKAMEAILLVNVGDKDFPEEEDQDGIKDLEAKLATRARSMANETVYKLITNHTVKMAWIYPPLDALLSETKYLEPNSDIMIGMGFSRTLLVGEALRSNAGQSLNATQGPMASLQDMRERVILWIQDLYQQLKAANRFVNVPEPRFAPMMSADIIALVQFALEAGKMGVLSQNTMARFFGTTFSDEHDQKETESNAPNPKFVLDPNSDVTIVANLPKESAKPNASNTGA